MAFVSGLFGGGPEKAQVDKGATVAQATNVYGQQQDAIQKQQDFANAVAAQNGLGNQNQVYQQLAGIANGTGPSVAQNQLAQATQANVANQAALMAGGRGTSQNAGLIARQAAMQGANVQQQGAGQMATLRAQEQTNALGQMGNLATTQVGQQQNSLANLSGATNTAQSNILGAINGQNSANVAATTAYNQAKQAQNDAAMKMVGGAIGGVATGGMSLIGPAAAAASGSGVGGGLASTLGNGVMLAAHGGMIPDHGRFVEAHNRLHGIKQEPKMMSEGGPVPGHAQVSGDSLKNDTQPTMLSPGEIVIPRSVVQSEDPIKAITKFAKKVLAGKGPSPTEAGGQKKMAGGGMTTENPDLQAPPQVEPVPDYTSKPDAPPTWGQKIPEFNQGKFDDVSNLSPENLARLNPAPQAGGDAPPDLSGQGAPTQQGPQDPYGFGAMSDATMAGYKNAIGGLNMQADAEGKKAQAESRAADEQMSNLQSMQGRYDSEYQKLDGDRQRFQDALMNGKIDPNHYLNGQSGGQRAGTAIGLILGGLSGGMTGQANPALDFLNKQIDRDIDAQKTELGKNENLLAQNMKQFGNLHDATMATKAMMTDIYSAKIMKAGADSGSEAAKARAMQAAGELQMKVAPMMQQMAMRKAMMSGGGSPEMKIRAMVPEGQQQPMFKELGEAQAALKSRDNLLGAFGQVNDLNTVKNAITSPLQRSKQVNAIIEPLVAQLSKESAGRFTEQDASAIKNMFPAVGDSQSTSELKYQRLNAFISSKLHFPGLQAYGINPMNNALYDENGQDRVKNKVKLGK